MAGIYVNMRKNEGNTLCKFAFTKHLSMKLFPLLSIRFDKNNDSTYYVACVGIHPIFKYQCKFVNENLDYTSVLNILIQTLIFKDTHREKALSNKTPALTKSTNMDIWVVSKTNQLFIRGSLIETIF